MITMNSATDYVHTAIVNYEPIYLELRQIVADWADDLSNPRAEYRDRLREAVEQHYAAAGLDLEDIEDSDVDYGVIIDYEMED